MPATTVRMSSQTSSSPLPTQVVSLPDLQSATPISPLNLPSNEHLAFPRLDPIIEHVKADHSTLKLPRPHRVSSTSSITFKSNGSNTPAGPKPPSRIRDSSPPPEPRFRSHVSFDNFSGAEPTDKNTISFTLNVKHRGYQFKRRSRTFMVGIDENDYSDIALQWMLEELVDDGDEIVCIRVVDRDAKVVSDRNVEKRQYQKQAKELLQQIQAKNDENRAISIVLEFAVGKLHTTFQKMIQLYEPAMLIVGTRGRSLGGFQGLVTNRNSFSKWCLQYSPIPVVVVRPTEKRKKKKLKRDADSTRQDYARILRESGVEVHETEHGITSSAFEASNDPDMEAHAVAAALGLPASFDPSVKPLNLEGSRPLKKVDSGGGRSDVTSVSQGSPDSRPTSPEALLRSPRKQQTENLANIIDEESSDSEDDDDEDEFEALPGHLLVNNGEERPELERKKKLHEMEVGEAAALAAGRNSRKASTGSTDSASPPLVGPSL